MTTTTPIETTLGVEDVCKVLGIGTTTFYALKREDPDFVTFKARGKVRMRREALEAWIRKQEEIEAA